MPSSTVVILAAGRGTRMRSATPKLAHDLCGRPLLAWPLAAARDAGAQPRSSSSSAATGRPVACSATDVEIAVQEQRARHRRRGRAPRPR